MKVSTQPMSAFAVYSEKLKQKKKRSKQNDTSRVTKLKKVKNPVASKVKKLEAIQVPSANPVKKPNKSGDKKTWQMKEIGYILQKLAERSTDSSNPRAAALLRSIDEANKKLETGNSVHQEDILANVLVTDMENFKKNGNLKRKKETTNGNSGSFYPTLHSNLEKSIFTGADLTDNGENCNNFESNKKKLSSSVKENTSGSQTNQLKFKKSKALMKGRHASNVLQLKAGTKKNKSQSKPGVKEVEGEQSGGVEVKIRKNINKLETKQDKKIEKTQQKILENVDTTAKKLFEWLILPVFERDFMSDFWEKKPLLIQREGNRKYFSELLSTETIDNMLRENNVCFTKHLDVTSYTDGVRETHNLTGRAQANVVWDFYSNGCSIRLLNPQIFLPKIHTLNATLQEYFGCFVGANVYLTPPNSQGFAPHYDDIEAFVMQIEGKKHWKVYNPRNDAEVLARFSSPNFSQEEIGEPFLDVTLEPGDLLYFPRGFIHQASTVEGEHSLHITLSAYQKTAWVDLFEKVLPIALRRAAESDVEFRRGLPRDYLGLEHRGSPREKQRFVETAQTLMAKLGDYIHLSLGAGVDLMGAQFMHDALPPVLLPGEKENSSVGGGLKLKNGKLEGRVEFQMDTSVKLIRFNVCRLVEEEDEVRLYHCLDNSLEYHGEDPQFLVLPPEGVQVVTLLQGRYPAYVRLRDIPHDDPEALITLISDLWDAGLLSAKDLPVVEES